jgi:hypothetical protein
MPGHVPDEAERKLRIDLMTIAEADGIAGLIEGAVAILNRQNSHESELRALRLEFDRFRIETREALARIEKLLTRKV